MAFLQAVLLTGNVARGKALTAKPDDPSSIPGTHVTEDD